MSSDLRLSKIPPSFRGLDAVSSPAYVRDGFAPVMTNFIPGRPGKVVLRGGIQQTASGAGGIVGPATTPWTGSTMFAHDDTIFGNFDSLQIQRYNVATDAWNFTAGTDQFMPSYARVGAQTNVATVSTLSKVFGWNGTALAALAQSPTNAVAVASHLNRFFVLGGSVPGTATPVFANQLYWVDDGAPGSGALTEWQDDVTILVNKLQIGDTDDYGMGLAVVNGVLYIFKRFSVYALFGTSPANFVVRRVLNIGAAAYGGILTTSTGVFFMSDAGWMFYDGAQLREVSEQVRTLVQGALWKNGPNVSSYKGGDRVSISAAPLSDDSYMLVATDLMVNGNVLFAGVYQMRTNSWWLFDAPITKLATLSGYTVMGPQRLVFTRQGTYCWDQKNMFRVDPIVMPGVPNFQVANAVQAARVGTDIGRITNGTTVVAQTAYGGQIDTRVLDLASPAKMSRLSRVLLDYDLERHADNPTANSRIDATVLDGQGNTIVAANQLLQGPGRQRAVVRDYSEIEELFLRFTYVNPDTLYIAKAELLDATIEWHGGRPRFA